MKLKSDLLSHGNTAYKKAEVQSSCVHVQGRWLWWAEALACLWNGRLKPCGFEPCWFLAFKYNILHWLVCQQTYYHGSSSDLFVKRWKQFHNSLFARTEKALMTRTPTFCSSLKPLIFESCCVFFHEVQYHNIFFKMASLS